MLCYQRLGDDVCWRHEKLAAYLQSSHLLFIAEATGGVWGGDEGGGGGSPQPHPGARGFRTGSEGAPGAGALRWLAGDVRLLGGRWLPRHQTAWLVQSHRGHAATSFWWVDPGCWPFLVFPCVPAASNSAFLVHSSLWEVCGLFRWILSRASLNVKWCACHNTTVIQTFTDDAGSCISPW